MPNLYSLTVQSIDNKPVALKSYQGKVLLFVNTASECGFTPQYADLQKLYDTHKASGLEILGFPSNSFGAQDPGSNSEIKQFCEKKFKVTFPMFSKVTLSGPTDNLEEPFRTLVKMANNESIKWNFEKFLVSRDGKLVQRFRSAVKPSDSEFQKALVEALHQGSATDEKKSSTAKK